MQVDCAMSRATDWQLVRTFQTPTGADASVVLEASDWLQRKLAAESTSPAVLARLADDGRTKRVRDAASRRRRSLAAG